jgi:hypothetical protein
MDWEIMDWIHLANDGDQYFALVKTFKSYKNIRKFLDELFE